MAYTKHSNGRLFRIPTGSPHCTNKKYSIGVQRIQKLQQPYKESLQPFFRNKKPQNPYLQILVFLPHLSSSSDLRILSSTQPSQISPMTDFRQVWCLHAYSGGTVRDSHPVFYSPVGLLPRPQALKRNIYLHGQYTRI